MLCWDNQHWSSQHRRSCDGRPHPTHAASWRGRRVLLLLCAVAFLDFVDASITNVALPHILTALNFSTQSLQWVPSAYLLTYGGFMLLGGRLADLLGRRNVLLAGTVAGGTVLAGRRLRGRRRRVHRCPARPRPRRCAHAPGRAVHADHHLHDLAGPPFGARGLGGCRWPRAQQAGILLGGVLTEGPGWRWVMFVNPIACVLVIPAVLALLPRDHPAARTPRFDLLGSVVVTGGMMLLVYALIKAPDQGWGAARTWLELAGAAVLLAGFLVIERYARDPILPMSIFRVPGLAAANLTGLIGFAGMLSMFYFLTLYMQNVLGYSPIVAGAAYLPLTFGIGISAGIGAKLLTKVGTRAVISAGALIAAGGLVLLSQIPVDGGYLAHILPGLLLVALGVGPVFVGVTTAANAGVGPNRAGLAAAILNSSQQIGGALGLAIFSAVGAARTHHLLTTGTSVPDATTSGLRHALATGAVFAAAAAVIAWATKDTHEGPDDLMSRRRRRRRSRPAVSSGRSRTHPPGEVAMNNMPKNDLDRILVIGRSPSVILDAARHPAQQGLPRRRNKPVRRGADDYDTTDLDVVVFGGMVPPDTKQHLRKRSPRATATSPSSRDSPESQASSPPRSRASCRLPETTTAWPTTRRRERCSSPCRNRPRWSSRLGGRPHSRRRSRRAPRCV